MPDSRTRVGDARGNPTADDCVARETPRWRFAPIAVVHAAAALLVATWLVPATRAAWDRLDMAVFVLLNGSLEGAPAAQWFWALANWRPMDLLPAGCLLGLMLWSVWGAPFDERVRRWATVGGLTIAMFVIAVAAQVVVRYVIHYDRMSPSLAVASAHRLSHLVPALDPKDASSISFPGDHAFVLLVMTGYFWYRDGHRAGMIAAMLAVAFSTPRVVAGAHWLSDVVVGGGAMALVTCGWTLGTPLGAGLARRLEPLVAWCGSRIPVLRDPPVGHDEGEQGSTRIDPSHRAALRTEHKA